MTVPPPPPFPPASGNPGTIENGRIEDQQKPSPPGFIVFMNVANTVTHLCLGAVALAAIFFANSLGFLTTVNSLTSHIYLRVTGYIILMSQAVLSMNPHTGWTQNLRHQTKRNIHWVMQIIGSILAISGSIYRITDLEKNFQSAHGSLGIVAMIFTILSLIGGVINLFSNNININVQIIRILHSCFGSLTLIIAFMALIFAFNSNFFKLYGKTNANLCITLTVVALVGTLLSPCITILRRIPNQNMS